MRGQILTFDVETGGGLISGEDGNRYAFSALDVIGQPPAVGTAIEFVAVDGYAREVVGLASPPVSVGGPSTSNSVDYTGEDLSLWGYFLRCMTSRYVDGNGRARRKEYWAFVLFSTIFLLAPGLIGTAVGAAIDPTLESRQAITIAIAGLLVSFLALLVMAMPAITVGVRRLHDVGLSGWLWLINLVPSVGGIFMLVVGLMPSKLETNIYGPIPGRRPRSRI